MIKLDPSVSEVMKKIRAKRTDYTTSGFSNPEVLQRALERSLATRRAKSAKKQEKA